MATGPSAKDVDLESGKGAARFLAIKDGWQLCPWADLLYGCDHAWWEHHRGVPQFKGPRAAYDPLTIAKFGKTYPFHKIDIESAHHRMLFGKTGTVGWGGNSGFHAINLAIQFGAKVILLVGFDFCIHHGLHFFGAHRYGARPRPNARTAENWVSVLDGEAPALEQLGIKVLNCSPISALRAFPKMSFKEALHANGSIFPRLRLEAGPRSDDLLQGGHDAVGDHQVRGESGGVRPGRDRAARDDAGQDKGQGFAEAEGGR